MRATLRSHSMGCMGYTHTQYSHTHTFITIQPIPHVHFHALSPITILSPRDRKLCISPAGDNRSKEAVLTMASSNGYSVSRQMSILRRAKSWVTFMGGCRPV